MATTDETNNGQVRKGDLRVVDWKSIGNSHYDSKKYQEAVASYTKGIEQGDNLRDLTANRSAAYLAISEYQLALDDAETVLKIDENHVKCIRRKARALFGLMLYREATMFLEQIKLDSIPPNDKL